MAIKDESNKAHERALLILKTLRDSFGENISEAEKISLIITVLSQCLAIMGIAVHKEKDIPEDFFDLFKHSTNSFSCLYRKLFFMEETMHDVDNLFERSEKG